jgi:hypothetical protein
MIDRPQQFRLMLFSETFGPEGGSGNDAARGLPFFALNRITLLLVR